MNRHLVPVKVGVVGSTNQRMQLDRFAFYQYRLECLNAQPMERRRAIEQHRMLADHFFENIPNFRFFHLYQFLGLFDGGRKTPQLELAVDEGPEELQRHFLRQSTLMEF